MTSMKFIVAHNANVCTENCTTGFYEYQPNNSAVMLVCTEECRQSYAWAVNETYSTQLKMCSPSCALFSSKVYMTENNECVETCPDGYRYDETIGMKKCSADCKWVE